MYDNTEEVFIYGETVILNDKNEELDDVYDKVSSQLVMEKEVVDEELEDLLKEIDEFSPTVSGRLYHIGCWIWRET